MELADKASEEVKAACKEYLDTFQVRLRPMALLQTSWLRFCTGCDCDSLQGDS